MMKGLFQKLAYGAPVADPVFRTGGSGNGLVLRPVSGRRAAALSATYHGDHSAFLLDTEQLEELRDAIEYILSTEQRTEK